MKKNIALFLILGLVTFGCVQQPATEYVCPDGTVVSNPSLCASSTEEQVSGPSLQEVFNLVGQKLTQSKIFQNNDVDNSGPEVVCIPTDYPKIELSTYDESGSCNTAEEYFRSDACISYYKTYDTWSCAKVPHVSSTVYYYDDLAPSYESVKQQIESSPNAKNADIMYSDSKKYIKIENYPFENDEMYWIYCKNKAWIELWVSYNDLNEAQKLTQAVNGISAACLNS